jgi:hypothetical protein
MRSGFRGDSTAAAVETARPGYALMIGGAIRE